MSMPRELRRYLSLLYSRVQLSVKEILIPDLCSPKNPDLRSFRRSADLGVCLANLKSCLQRSLSAQFIFGKWKPAVKVRLWWCSQHRLITGWSHTHLLSQSQDLKSLEVRKPTSLLSLLPSLRPCTLGPFCFHLFFLPCLGYWTSPGRAG